MGMMGVKIVGGLIWPACSASKEIFAIGMDPLADYGRAEHTVYSPDAAQYLKVRPDEDGEVEIEAINRAATGVPVWLDRQGIRRLRDLLNDQIRGWGAFRPCLDCDEAGCEKCGGTGRRRA